MKTSAGGKKLPLFYELRSFVILFTEPSPNLIVNQSNKVHIHTHNFSLRIFVNIILLFTLKSSKCFPSFLVFRLFLCAFAKLRKAYMCFVMHVLYVRPSKCNNLALTGSIFMKFDISVFFENVSRKPKFY